MTESRLIGEGDIARVVRHMAEAIRADVPESLTLLVVLDGAFMFGADLARAIQGDCEVCFVQADSYGDARESGGDVGVGPMPDIAGRHVVVVDDVLDSGRTIAAVVERAHRAGAASVRAAVLLEKQTQDDRPAKYVGFAVGGAFVFGYGMDRAGRHGRNLPDVWKEEP